MRASMLRRLIAASLLCWALTPAAPAHAQAPSPLANCDPKTFSLNFRGKSGGDDKAGTITDPGGVQLNCSGTIIYADEITWDEKTARARGHLVVIQQDLRVTAERVEMDRQTHLGVFYKAAGTARITDKPVQGSAFGSLEPEVSFYAEKLEKIGPRSYRLTDGWFSTCLQANPRWDIRGSSGTVTLDEHVLLRNAVMRVKGIPVFYLPIMYYPLGEDDRSTGFLIPKYGSTSVGGQQITNAFFWAIDRSQNLTVFHDWYSKSGQGVGGEYEFISALGSRGKTNFYMMDELERRLADGTLQRTARRSYQIDGNVNQNLGRYFRAFGRVRYFTDISTIQLYQQNAYDVSQRQRYLTGTLNGNKGRYRLTVFAEQRDLYTDPTTAQRSGRLPAVSFNVMDKPLGHSKVYFGVNSELAGILNQSNISLPSTSRSLWRFDTAPTIRAPLSSLPYLSGTASATYRLTYWTDSLDPVTGTPEPVSITRPLAEVRADVLGPVVSRVFQTPKSGYAERWKHVIEPRASVEWLSPFEHVNNVINNDPGIDCRVGGNTTLSYSLYNRLYARRKQPGGAGGRVAEIFSMGVSQSYYTREAAGACDTQYQTSLAGRFSAIQVNAVTSPKDSVQGRFQMYIDSHTKQPESYSASVSTFGRATQFSAMWSKRQFLPNVPGYDNELFAAHSLSGLGSWRTTDGRYGGSMSLRLDVKQKQFLERRVSVFYNAQCCGLSVAYQIVNVAHLGVGLQTDHRFNFSFTLAGIGSFSNPMGSFGR